MDVDKIQPITVTMDEMHSLGLREYRTEYPRLKLEKFLIEAVNNKLRDMFPEEPEIPWQFEAIKFYNVSNSYVIKIKSGWPHAKG